MDNPRIARSGTSDEFMVCVVCGLDFLSEEGFGTPRHRVGYDTETGHQVFACIWCVSSVDARWAGLPEDGEED